MTLNGAHNVSRQRQKNDFKVADFFDGPCDRRQRRRRRRRLERRVQRSKVSR